eukprot:m.435112 g.435112  ORF g.435112 m.435112 type:complete len:326 (+) comp17814_c0_seq1:2786-3763(+)
MPRDRLAELDRYPQVSTLDNAAVEAADVEKGKKTPWATYRDEEMDSFFASVKKIRHDFLRQIETATPEVEAGYDELIRAASKRETAMATNRIEKYGEMIKTTSSRTKVHLDNMPSRTEEFRSRLEAHLISMGASKHEAQIESKGNSDVRIRQAQYKSLMARFIAVMSRYNDVQQRSKDRHVEDLVQQIKTSDPHKFDSATGELEARRLAESGESLTLLSNSDKLATAEEALGRIRGRHEDIQRLAKSLAELHQMFLDMAIMVEQQGAMVDQIEDNVAKSANYVVRAKVQLTKARKFQAKAREKRNFCIGASIAAAALLIIIIVYA